MKTLRRLLIIMMVLAITVSLPASLRSSAEKMETHTVLSDNDDLINALDRYFAQRRNEYLDCRKAVNDITHQNYIRDWAAELSITINSSKNNYTIKDIIEADAAAVKVLVYEWVTLDYTWHDPDTGEEWNDTMGFGTDHAITINLESGIVENDSYIEINEYEHYREEDLQYIYSEKLIFDDCDGTIDVNTQVVMTSTSYSAADAVAYSNMWCGQSVEGHSSSQNPNNYNPLYYYYEFDCCNFVSQCLANGGLPMVSGGWHTTLNPSATTPVQDKGGSYSTHSWVSVVKFKEYMQLTAGYPCITVSDTSDCLIGNPIFWLYIDGNATNHNMLIVGKLGSNIVLVNAHNSDAYRFPQILSSKIFYTFDYVHDYSAEPYSNLKHKCTCSVCGDVCYQQHSWVDHGTYFECTECGATSQSIIVLNVRHSLCKKEEISYID